MIIITAFVLLVVVHSNNPPADTVKTDDDFIQQLRDIEQTAKINRATSGKLPGTDADPEMIPKIKLKSDVLDLGLVTNKGITTHGAKVLILGLTFKENCPDLRNTKVVDIVAELESYGTHVDVHDPWVNTAEAKAEYGFDLVADPAPGEYDVVVLAVAHDQFRALGTDGIRSFCKENAVVYDIKYVLPADQVDDRL